MGTIASQITSLTIVYWTVYSGANQRKHQSSASPAFVLRIHRWPVYSPHTRPETRKMFPFDDVIMHRNSTRYQQRHLFQENFNWCNFEMCNQNTPGSSTSTAPLWFNLNLSMGKYNIHYKVWDEITYPFPIFNGCTAKVKPSPEAMRPIANGTYMDKSRRNLNQNWKIWRKYLSKYQIYLEYWYVPNISRCVVIP